MICPPRGVVADGPWRTRRFSKERESVGGAKAGDGREVSPGVFQKASRVGVMILVTRTDVLAIGKRARAFGISWRGVFELTCALLLHHNAAVPPPMRDLLLLGSRHSQPKAL